MALGRAIVAAMGIVSVGISTRYLGVDAYGALATAIAFVAVANIMADVGIWTIGTREISKRPTETQRILGALMSVGFGLSVLALIVAIAVALLLYAGGDDALTRKAVLLLLVTLPLAAPFSALNAYYLARQQAYVGVGVTVAGSVATLGLVAGASVFDWGFTGVVLAYVAAAAVQGAVVVAFSVGKVRLRPSRDLPLTKQLLGWAAPLGGALVVHSLYWRIDILLLAALAANSEVALYALAYRIVDALTQLPGFVTVTLFPELARQGAGHERFHDIVEKGFTVMAVAAVGMLVLFVTFADELAQVVGGSAFSGAAPVLQLLMFGVALTFLSGIPAIAIVSANRQKDLLRMSLAVLPLNVGLNLAMIPTWGASGAAVAFVISELAHLGWLLWIYRKVGPLPQVRRAPQLIAAAGLTAGFVLLGKLLPPANEGNPFAVLLVGGTSASAAYLAALYAFKAMPSELHTHLILPVWTRLRPRRLTA